jgi:hypothetical protein
VTAETFTAPCPCGTDLDAEWTVTPPTGPNPPAGPQIKCPCALEESP